MNMLAGLDIGNGYVKGLVSVDGKKSVVDFPSVVAIETNNTDMKTKLADAGKDIEDLFNVMEASFDSPVVGSKSNRLFGLRGIHSGKAQEEFDVASTVSKANQDLSGILILGCLAGAALKQYYEEKKMLPESVLQVKARIAIALPITEYKMYRKIYVERFQNIRHMVSVHNFEQPVRVEVLIEDVQVLAEGASAQFAIVNYGAVLMDAMLADLRAHGEKLEGITSQDVLSANNTIGIDVGEGTVNFPVFQDGRFNPDASITFAKGYGTVLEQAREQLQLKGINFSSRKALADFLLTEGNPLQRNRRTHVLEAVQKEMEGFVQELGVQFRKVLSRVGAYTEVIYVYGGGALNMKDVLYPALLNMVKQFGGEDAGYPILYLPDAYARQLNREGLYIVAEQVAAAKK